MTLLQAVILGIVEGLTEFIPVSSTGHLLLTNSLMGVEGKAANSFVIVIQFGAIMAVVAYYRSRLMTTFRTAGQRGSDGQRLIVNLAVAFVPAAVTGLLLQDFIEERLMTSNAWVAAALILGGIVMIVVDRWLRPTGRRVERIEDVTWRDALWVGLAQCFALWPGMSRSMTTIVGGQLRGFSNSLAADFSFLLALPTLGAATLYKLVSDRDILLAMEGGLAAVLVGLAVSFAVAWLAIAVFLRIVKRVGMAPFGAYRIVVGLLVIWMVFAGRL